MTKHCQPSTRISDHTLHLCTSGETVSSLLAHDPNLRPSDAWDKLYSNAARKGGGAAERGPNRQSTNGHDSTTETELEQAARCGNWGPTKPSDLFLKSRLPDIARHMSNLIVRAKEEVFLATNYWQNSVASKYITDAIRELDRRAGEAGTRVVVKIIYDRGSPRQLYQPHYIVSEKVSTGKDVNLPSAAEIPNIDLEVMNYHTPLMGTFHAKYMVVDRKIAVLQSNNIQDNDNLEMMVHLEGPIVDSVYDMALISWHRRLDPPLPSQTAGLVDGEKQDTRLDKTDGGTTGDANSEKGKVGPTKDDKKPVSVVKGEQSNGAVTDPLNQDLVQETRPLPQHTADDPHYDEDIAGELARSQASLAPKPRETHLQAVTRLLNHTLNEGLPGDPGAPECPPGDFMTPYLPHLTGTPCPMALVNRAPYGPPTHGSVSNPQNAAWLSALRNAQKSVYIVSPTLNASPVLPAIIEACERGVDVHCYICLSYNDAVRPPLHPFSPQTNLPPLTNTPFPPKQGELLPRQGGHNEGVSAHLHRTLTPTGRTHLHYHWYVAKDQTRPITQASRQRSSHVKLLIADGAVAVQGNGNQDTQSWFHSQEANLLVDSAELCGLWLEGLRRNQNTGLFGAVGGLDGVWRDGRGEEVEGAMGVEAGRVRGWARGVKGAVERVRGTGGF
ncbi:hypothetical protein CHGG_04259 [Chaetomium globosum CBS 148.51]|uniref:PLD phosphodiesterase domain-containing protein n=1 Tax=Chaetomium globosum (strain ATCC 6205 / CBS 148.51 / DSM 1962 / NBRC 6347 / NRRL 1970) TaxID=306901 RepID=Q2H1T7_CHAGB|nr:uncharacterized protein CHGG_04259 [Chaetomium globosum CBS 148.51]EAQ87640.1 hypothetical protein CHGG_04259 [Chaetomium globosum CBS 148.51]